MSNFNSCTSEPPQPIPSHFMVVPTSFSQFYFFLFIPNIFLCVYFFCIFFIFCFLWGTQKWVTTKIKNTEIFQCGLVVIGDLSRCNIFGGGEKYKEFSKWFHCTRQPAQMEDEKVVRNAKISQNGFNVTGNRPKQKILKVVRNARNSQNGFIVTRNQPKWKMKRVFKEV